MLLRKKPDDAFTYDVALERLMYAALLGFVVIVFYGWRLRSLGVISVGLMIAGASMFAGGLVGFLFGVPHARDVDLKSSDEKKTPSDKGAHAPASSPYKPSTSLEQISDWLTKILVGVGLVDFRQILAKLSRLGDYLAPGVSVGETTQSAKAFVLATLVYFSICGFVFAFLWARICLPRWFAEADVVKRLLSDFERQRQADARAFVLGQALFNPGPQDSPVTQEEALDTISDASDATKTELLSQARAASGDFGSPTHQVKLKGAILVLNSLIAIDKDELSHKNYSELSYALWRLKPQDFEGAERAINKAIQIRDKQRLRGWKYYEFRRARYRIEHDEKFRKNAPSEPSLVAAVMPDLRIACGESDWKKWLTEGEGAVQKWLDLNKIDPSTP
jgi:hypothetical protein